MFHLQVTLKRLPRIGRNINTKFIIPQFAQGPGFLNDVDTGPEIYLRLWIYSIVRVGAVMCLTTPKFPVDCLLIYCFTIYSRAWSVYAIYDCKFQFKFDSHNKFTIYSNLVNELNNQRMGYYSHKLTTMSLKMKQRPLPHTHR